MRLLLKFKTLQGKHFAMVIKGNLLRLHWGSTVRDFMLRFYFIRKYRLWHHACVSVCVSFPSIIFFCGEGPRSRSYGRTAALRLIMQPCGEDEEKDYDFFIFPTNGAPVG
jgi:hypothetical protein